MFRHIVVPLDGSVAARQGLAVAAEVAPLGQRCIAAVLWRRTAIELLVTEIQCRQPDLIVMVRRPRRWITRFGRDLAHSV